MGRRLALLIGASEYDDKGLSQLPVAANDITEFADVLVNPKIGNFEIKQILNGSESEVRIAIDDFCSNRQPDDMLLLYFSGHGVRGEFGDLYLTVTNTNRARLRSTAISTKFISEAMDQSRAKQQVIILDCCNSGAFILGSESAIGMNVGTKKVFINKRSEYQRVVMTAADSIQFALDDDHISFAGAHLGNSVFTRFLVQGLRTGRADIDNSGNITHDELFEYVSNQIKQITNKQSPSMWTSTSIDVVIARNPKLSSPESNQEQVDTSPSQEFRSHHLDKELEINVLKTKLKGLLDQLEIQTINLNRFQLDKAKFGGQLVPPVLETSIIEVSQVISDLEGQIQAIKEKFAKIEAK